MRWEPIDVVLWAVMLVLVGALVIAVGAPAEVPLTVQQPVGTLEDGRVRIYELGARCYIVVTDGPMGKPLIAAACK